MELLILLTVMLMSFGLAFGIMKAALQLLLFSMSPATERPVRRRIQVGQQEQLAA